MWHPAEGDSPRALHIGRAGGTLSGMRIALVIEHLDRRRGGAEVYVHDFAAWLLRAGHEVAIVTEDAHDPPAGAEVHTAAASGCPLCGCVGDFAEASREALARLGPDVSLATGKALGMSVYQPHGGTVRGSQRQNAALVRSANLRALKLAWNRVSPKHWAARSLEARQFANPRTHFVAVSQMVRRDMRTFYGLPEERITVIYNGVDLERFHPERVRARREETRRRFGVGEGMALFLFVAHNFRLKGLGELIRALGVLRGAAAGGSRAAPTVRECGAWSPANGRGMTMPPAFHLLVAGRGRAGPYRRLARRCGVADRVTFAGATAEVEALYGAADALAHPTWYDPCSLVALEALACGLPVLTTRFNGASELMAGRECGVVLDGPRSVSRLGEGIGQLLDAGSRARMSVAARRVAEEHPQERNFREMLGVLERAART